MYPDGDVHTRRTALGQFSPDFYCDMKEGRRLRRLTFSVQADGCQLLRASPARSGLRSRPAFVGRWFGATFMCKRLSIDLIDAQRDLFIPRSTSARSHDGAL